MIAKSRSAPHPVKPVVQILAPVLLAVLCGCEPEERVQWSPDGSRAAFLFDSRLHFADASGRLAEPLPDRETEAGRWLVDRFDWLPDGSGLVVHRVRLAPDWESVAARLSPAEASRVEGLAARVPDLLRAAVAIHGDADRADLLLGKLLPGEGLLSSNVLQLALRDDADSVRAALAEAPRALASLDSGAKERVVGYVVHETALVRPGEGGGGQVIASDLKGGDSLRVSPRHPFVARVVNTGAADRFDLEILPLDGAPAIPVARGVTRAFGWTPDGGALVLMAPLSPDGGGNLMKIERRRVLDQAGRPVGEDEPEELAYALVPFAPRLAVLPDGAVLFAGQPGSLPAAAGQPGERPRLYRIPPEGGPPVAVPTAEGALPMDLGYFAASPDGRRLVVVESATDAVAVLDLESGQSELVSPPHPGWRTRLLPSWRDAEAFTYAALDPLSGRVGWRLWRDGESTDLSADWPADIAAAWLEFRDTPP